MVEEEERERRRGGDVVSFWRLLLLEVAQEDDKDGTVPAQMWFVSAQGFLVGEVGRNKRLGKQYGPFAMSKQKVLWRPCHFVKATKYRLTAVAHIGT